MLQFGGSEYIRNLYWHTCRVTLRNLYSAAAKEHSLAIFDAILKFTANRENSIPLFHPNEALSYRLSRDKAYTLNLVFPHGGKEDAERFLDALASWLKTGRRHFELLDRGNVQRRSLGTLQADFYSHYPHAETAEELCLNFLTPLPHLSADKVRKRAITASELIDMCCRRLERLYGPLPTEERKILAGATQELFTLPWMWEYQEFRHSSKSSSGSKYINGFMGPLWLRGNIQSLLSLLLICQELHLGRRLHAGQGAFSLCLGQTFGDRLLPSDTLKHQAQKSLEMEGKALLSESDPLLHRQKLYLLLMRIVRHACPEVLQRFESGKFYEQVLPGSFRREDLWEDILPLADKNTRSELQENGKSSGTDSLERLLRVWEQWHVEKHPLPAPAPDAQLTPAPELYDEDAVAGTTASRKPLCIIHPHVTLCLEHDEVQVRHEGKTMLHVRLDVLESITLQGGGSISLPLLRKCLEKDIPLLICSGHGKLQGMLSPETPTWHQRLTVQHNTMEALGQAGRLGVAARILLCKVDSYRQWLPRVMKGGKEEFEEAAMQTLRGIVKADSHEVLLGLEGSFARRCFRAVNNLVLPAEFTSKRRDARKRADPWNTLVDTASSLLFARIHMYLRAQGLDPCSGFLHLQHDRFATLAADIQEMFRQRTDRWLLKMINQNVLRPEHLDWTMDAWSLNREGWLIFQDFFEREMQTRLAGDVDTLAVMMEKLICCLRFWLCAGRDFTLLRQGKWWITDLHRLLVDEDAIFDTSQNTNR